MKKNLLGLCLLSILLLSYAPMFGQKEEPRNFYNKSYAQRDAIIQMEELRQGKLVVRLATNANKIASLKKAINSSFDARKRSNLEAMLEKTILDTKNQNRWLKEAFDSNYTFTPVIYMPDTLASQLKAGARQGIFLGPSLEIDPTLSLEGKFFVAYYGPSASSEKTGNDGINMLDSTLQPLRSPFPFFTGRTSIRRIFDEFFNKKTDRDHLFKLVAKFQAKLLEF